MLIPLNTEISLLLAMTALYYIIKSSEADVNLIFRTENLSNYFHISVENSLCIGYVSHVIFIGYDMCDLLVSGNERIK
jgi:hypothetical protein